MMNQWILGSSQAKNSHPGEACFSLLEAVSLRLGLWRGPGPRNGKKREETGRNGKKRAMAKTDDLRPVIREFGGCHPVPSGLFI